MNAQDTSTYLPSPGLKGKELEPRDFGSAPKTRMGKKRAVSFGREMKNKRGAVHEALHKLAHKSYGRLGWLD